jgi:hypothetical protein
MKAEKADTAAKISPPTHTPPPGGLLSVPCALEVERRLPAPLLDPPGKLAVAHGTPGDGLRDDDLEGVLQTCPEVAFAEADIDLGHRDPFGPVEEAPEAPGADPRAAPDFFHDPPKRRLREAPVRHPAEEAAASR